jgi:hypothetical protein
MVFAMPAGQALAQYSGSYQAGAATMSLYPGACQKRTISLDGSNFGTSPLVSGGFLITNDNESAVDITDSECYDGTLTPAVWDAGVTPVFDPTGYPGGVFVAATNLGAGVIPSANILVCDVTICGVNGSGGMATITIDTVPGFDTWVAQDFTVYDPYIDPAVITVTSIPMPCECTITGPAVIQASHLEAVTVQYSASGNIACMNAPVYLYSTDCVQSTIDPNTGILTVPPTSVSETCTIAVTDIANTDINTGSPITCSYNVEIFSWGFYGTEIALGRACPGEEIDDPAYNRPGRRGLAATCGDSIDFTICSFNPLCDADDAMYNPGACAACMIWTIEPNVSGSTFEYLAPCCWRLTIGDICEQLDKVLTETITVTDTCMVSTDSVEIAIGKVIVEIGDTNIQPNTESGLVDISLINPEHAVRAITLDIAACDATDDNLVCTQCLVDPDRALDFTCSANEQDDGSCRVVLYSTDPSAMITQGRGAIAQVVYTAGPELEDLCGSDACIDLCPINISVSDQFNEDLCVCESPGEVCFTTCGDIYPQDCIGGTCGADTCCGDGMIDLFDILEAVDIILNLQIATDCQLNNGDVPNGVPPYCGNPPGTPNCERDSDIDIFDVLVMIDKALGKMNCCDYCLYGEIF